MKKSKGFILALVVLTMMLGGSPLMSICREVNTVFGPGERVFYHAYYNWNFIWINAGKVTFEVTEARWGGEPALRLSSIGVTHKSYDRFFRVRDTFEVHVDPLTIQPFQFRQVTNQGSYSANHHYLFHEHNRTIRTAISREGSPVKTSVIDWPECTFDVLSMIYRARNIDFSRHEIGDIIPIRMIVDGEIHDSYIRFLGIETIKNREGKWFRCLKFTPLLVEGTIFSAGEGMTVWVTDDLNRVPILVEAKILVGSVKAFFYKAEGLKHPVTAQVDKP